MSATAITDLARTRNLSFIPREFFPDYEEKERPEVASPLPSPLDCLLARENSYSEKTEIEESLCFLPSSFFDDGFGTYSIFFPPTRLCATRENLKAYVSTEDPEPLIPDDNFKELPKLEPIRILDKRARFEAHGKRGKKPFTWKDSSRPAIRKLSLFA